MADLTLYHAAPSRSSVVLWMLEEIGEPYDIHLLSLKQGTNREPDYLAVNPMGKVPALRHGETVITEVAAIWPTPFRTPASTFRSMTLGAVPTSSGCSSGRACLRAP
jgi:hypothetical protein